MSTKFILSLLIFSCLHAKAQFSEPGQKVIGGGINLSHSDATQEFNSPNYSLTEAGNYGLNVSYGKFKRKNVLREFAVGFNHSKNSYAITPPNSNVAEDLSNHFYLTYGQTWFKSIAKNLYFGVGGNFSPSYGRNNHTRTDIPANSKIEAYQFSFQIFPALNYQFSKRFLVDLRPSSNFLSAGYRYAKSENMVQGTATSGHQNSFYLNTGFFNSPLSNIGIGFKYLLR